MVVADAEELPRTRSSAGEHLRGTLASVWATLLAEAHSAFAGDPQAVGRMLDRIDEHAAAQERSANVARRTLRTASPSIRLSQNSPKRLVRTAHTSARGICCLRLYELQPSAACGTVGSRIRLRDAARRVDAYLGSASIAKLAAAYVAFVAAIALGLAVWGSAWLALIYLAALSAMIAYLVPGLLASVRRHRQEIAIWVLTLFAGWTFAGWVIALVWACVNEHPSGRTELDRLRRTAEVEAIGSV